MPVLFLLFSQSGCLSFLNRIPEPQLEVQKQNEQLPIESRCGVYVFLVNGTDPFGSANLYGVRDYLNKLGFVKSYYGEFFHEWWLIEEIRQLHKEKPDARIVVVGYEYGADAARSIALAGVEAGAGIDMLMYLEPKGLSFSDMSSDHPGIKRLVVLRKEKWFLTDSDVPGSETISLPCSNRYLVPTHSSTLDIIAEEVTHLAMSIPVISPPTEAFPQLLDDPAPTPAGHGSETDSTRRMGFSKTSQSAAGEYKAVADGGRTPGGKCKGRSQSPTVLDLQAKLLTLS